MQTRAGDRVHPKCTGVQVIAATSDAAKQHGRLDVVFANAGIGPGGEGLILLADKVQLAVAWIKQALLGRVPQVILVSSCLLRWVRLTFRQLSHL